MPNWKKVVVSGSDAILSSITSSAGISSSGDIYAPNFIGTATQVSITDFSSGGNLDLVINAGLNENSLFNIPDGLLSYNADTNTLISNNFSGSLTGTASYATYASNSLDISGNVNNRVLTATGNNTLNAEQNLSFNGSTLELTGSLTIDANNPITIKGQVGNVLTIRNEGSTDIIKIGDVNLNDGETLITVNDNSNTITLDASNKLDINANIDVSSNNITASIISASSFIGNLTGTSTLASNLTGTPSIIVNNITASGNISASGDLYSTHVFIPQGINTGDAGLIFGDTITGDSGYIADNEGKLVIGYNDTDIISISDESNESLTLAGNTRITGHITASKNVSVSGDLIVGGNITANQYIVSSSVTYMTQSFSSGSTVFGDTLDDTHQFTGSVDITGSLSIPGFTDVSASLASKGNTNTTGTPSDNQIAVWTNSNTIEGTSDFTFDAGALIVEGGGTTIFNNQNDDATFQIKGSSDDNLLQVNPQSGDKVGIGTSTPSEKLTVEGNISSSGLITALSASIDHVLVNDKLQGNGPGFQFFAYNEDTVKVKFANWYSSNDRQYGMGQLWYETWFAAIDNQAGRDNRRIGFYLEEPDAGSTDSGTPGQHPTNARFYVDITGSYIASGGLYVTDADFEVSSTGHVTASGNISASGNLSADHLILNPNTTTTGSNNTETQIDISLGNEEYKRGVIKRVFDFRENLASPDDIGINNQVIADIGEFKKGTLDVTIELNGYRPDSESFNTDTASLNQNIKIHTVPTTAFNGSAVDILLEEGAVFGPFLPLLNVSTIVDDQLILYNSLLKIDNEQIKFNVNDINNANMLLSSSLAIVYIDYQLYK